MNQEIFFNDWEIESTELLDEVFLWGQDKVYYEYGYVATSLEENDDFVNTVLTKYDINGDVLTQKKLTNTMFLDMKIHGENIYVIEGLYSNITDEAALYALVLDTNLSIENQYYLGGNDLINSLIGDILYSRVYGFNLIDVDDKGNAYYYSFSNNFVIQFGEDGVSEADSGVFDNYYSYVKRFNSVNDSNNAYYGYDKKDKTEVMSGAFSANPCLSALKFDVLGEGSIGLAGVDSKCESVGAIKLLVDGKEEWTQKYNDYTIIFEPQLVDSYIVALGVTEEETHEVIVVDLEGNLLQKITESEVYLFITGGDKSFMVSALNQSTSEYCSSNNIKSAMSEKPTSTCYDINNEVWYIPLNIKTKATGSGTITAVDTSRYGEEVTFTVTPDDGYVLGEVKVTDALGNVVIFKENTFTMPNADVLIEAIFVVENPDTYDIALPFIIILGAIFGVVIIKKVKEFKWINS